MHSTTRLLLAAAAVILLSAAPAARAQETENERKFSYIPGSPNGPANWSALNRPFWDACNNESNQAKQSPIDLADDRVKPMLNLGFLDYSYQPAQATIENRGHDIEVKFTENAGRLVINGKTYQLMQLHWHTPAEHTVNGRRYDLELHLVHSDGNNNAVIGNLYEIGSSPDPFLLMLEPYIRILIANRTDNSKPMPIGKVDPSIAKSRDAVYYRYNGSLTTPACTEGVIWTVFKRTQTVANYQLDLLRDAVDDGYENNARPLQKLNNRTISIFKPSIL